MSHWEASGKSDNWHTPKAVFDALGAFFDMDVAGSQSSADVVPANRRLWFDSLAHTWEGFIWMNPPFGGRNGIEPWLDRFFAHGNGIALAPDRTSAPWFQRAFVKADLVLFTPKLKFVRDDGSVGDSPSNGTALFAVGVEGVAALKRGARAGLGVLAIPLTVAA